MEEKFNLSDCLFQPEGCAVIARKDDIKKFINQERDLLNELFKKIKIRGNGQGIINKIDWDRFIIKRMKLAGDKFK